MCFFFISDRNLAYTHALFRWHFDSIFVVVVDIITIAAVVLADAVIVNVIVAAYRGGGRWLARPTIVGTRDYNAPDQTALAASGVLLWAGDRFATAAALVARVVDLATIAVIGVVVAITGGLCRRRDDGGVLVWIDVTGVFHHYCFCLRCCC